MRSGPPINRRPPRHLPGARGVVVAVAISVALRAAAAPAAPRPEDLQDPGQLENLVATEARKHLPPLTTAQRLQVGPLQPRLQLTRCAAPVRAERASGIQVPGRVLIELRCDAPTAWHLYVPARVIGTVPVVLAAHALVAGTVLGEKDLVVEQRDVVGLPPGFLDDKSIAVGLTAARGIAGGSIMTNQALVGTQAIQRGQMVTLVADAGGISVRMAGRALSDGLVNQRVRVENLSSGKIVEGIARSPQIVEIVF